MAQRTLSSFLGRASWTCHRCRTNQWPQRSRFSTTSITRDEPFVRAAPEIDFNSTLLDAPARIIPASPSYFTGEPVFNDNLLKLQALLNKHQAIPQVPADRAPRMAWLRLSQYRSNTGERIGASKYSQILRLLTRLNRIHPQLRPGEITRILESYQRPGSAKLQQAKPGTIDVHGRSKGVGRRKESSAQVFLVEGTGEILVNGKSVVEAFPRIHDRESAIWPLKISERLDKYNIFALINGGGVTGQAEAMTLAVAKALLVHEPALKPILRRGKSFNPVHDIITLTLFSSWMCDKRSEDCGKKKARSTESPKATNLGETLSGDRLLSIDVNLHMVCRLVCLAAVDSDSCQPHGGPQTQAYRRSVREQQQQQRTLLYHLGLLVSTKSR